MQRARKVLLAVCCASAIAASCGSEEGGTASNIGGSSGSSGDASVDAPAYTSVSVEPAQVTLTVQLGGTASQAYKAFATIDGQQTDVTDQCGWSVADSSFGTFAGATLGVADRGGTTTVVASCGGASGTSALTVKLTGNVVDPSAPANAETLFTSATAGTDPARTPAIEYPLDGAVAPRNIPSVEAQWTAAGNDLFHVTVSSTHLDLHVYTPSLEATFSQSQWESVTETVSGDTLTYTVEGLSTAAPADKFASTPVVLNLSNDRIDNTAIYWWASSKGSLLEQVFGETDAPGSVKGSCTSCHSLSRQGTRIGYSRCVGGSCSELYGGFLKYDSTTKTWVESVDADSKPFKGSYSTFAPLGNPFPTDAQSVALFALAAGNLELYDPDTGAVVPSNVATASVQDPSDPTKTRTATMPDWSPDGNTIVFASTPNAGQWIDISQSAIATMSYSYAGGTHTFGSPSLIVSGTITLPSGTYDNFFFPSWSPDGNLIVFNAARAAWRNSTDAASPGQRLMLTDKAGSWHIELEKMNGTGDLDITWPHWAPSVSQDYLWIVFSSQRDYGHRVTAANSDPSCIANGVKQCKQIWIGAIDKKKLATPGVDPSAPPVWLPGQDIDADNISPYWTLPATRVPQ